MSYPEYISLLRYADDTTFSIKGSVEEEKNLSTLLLLFVDFSGLQLSCAKSAFVGLGLSQEEAQYFGAKGCQSRSLICIMHCSGSH